MEVGASPLLREEEIGARRLRAQLAVRIGDAHVDAHQVVSLLPDTGPQVDPCVGGAHGAEVADLHLRRHAAGLELAEYHPTADLVGQRRLNPSVQGIHPTLVLRTGPPAANHLLSVLVKFHPQAARMARIAAVAVVPVHALPGVDDLFHPFIRSMIRKNKHSRE